MSCGRSPDLLHAFHSSALFRPSVRHVRARILECEVLWVSYGIMAREVWLLVCDSSVFFFDTKLLFTFKIENSHFNVHVDFSYSPLLESDQSRRRRFLSFLACLASQ